MADKYALSLNMRFTQATDAADLRKACESALADGLTTVGDRYSVSVEDETGECLVAADLRFSTKAAHDKAEKAARDAKVKVKPGTTGGISTHVCKHDAGGRGIASCGQADSDEWGDVT